MNNFEKIKQMTVDEMAEFLCVRFNCNECPLEIECNGCGIWRFKTWLLQEVEE